MTKSNASFAIRPTITPRSRKNAESAKSRTVSNARTARCVLSVKMDTSGIKKPRTATLVHRAVSNALTATVATPAR